MQALGWAGEKTQSFDQAFVDGVELVGGRRDLSARLHVLQPSPLENGAFKQAGRRVGIEFEQLCRTVAIIGEVETAIKIALVAAPGADDRVVIGLRNGHSLHQRTIRNDPFDGGIAHFAAASRKDLPALFLPPRG